MSSRVLPARIAWRYLRAPKSHSAVSAISIISVVGVAVATAAIVCVLSVFNGFRGMLDESLGTLSPDVMVTPSAGKTFHDADSVRSIIGGIDGVAATMPSVTDNALAIFQSREMPVLIRGVDPDLFTGITKLDSLIVDGGESAVLSGGNAAISVGVARQLAIFGQQDTPLFIFAPKREGRVNLANPMTSFITDSLTPAATFQTLQSEYDDNSIICDIEVARSLFQYDREATAIEVTAKPGVDIQKLAADISDRLGSQASVKDRMQQQDINFRMVSIEKWVTFLLLIFILLIASFNIISTLCMLIIEKQQSMSTLASLGMGKSAVGKVFWWESIFVTLLGGGAGIAAGLVLCLVQQHFGLIKLGGDPSTMVVDAYPVIVKISDIAIASIPVVCIGLLTASISSAFARSRTGLPG